MAHVGRVWTDNLFLKKIQEWYPDPPLVLFISNNEHSKLQWSEVEMSKRYLDTYGPGKTERLQTQGGRRWLDRALLGAMLGRPCVRA